MELAAFLPDKQRRRLQRAHRHLGAMVGLPAVKLAVRRLTVFLLWEARRTVHTGPAARTRAASSTAANTAPRRRRGGAAGGRGARLRARRQARARRARARAAAAAAPSEDESGSESESESGSDAEGAAGAEMLASVLLQLAGPAAPAAPAAERAPAARPAEGGAGALCAVAHHTVLTGPPGTGKTTLAQILGDIWFALGVTRTARVTTVTRNDFVGKYMGSSGEKTRATLKRAEGGVLFVDEAYSLVTGSTDDYGHEVLAELVEFMSNGAWASRTVLVFAGYEAQMKQLEGVNSGFSRRITWRFNLPRPSPEQLAEIFELQAKRSGWRLVRPHVFRGLFRAAHAKLRGGGGTTKQLLLKAQVEHANRALDAAGGVWAQCNVGRWLEPDDLTPCLEDATRAAGRSSPLSYFM